MNSSPRRRRLTAAALTALAVTTTATACGSGSDGAGSNAADSGTYTIWDPYPQFDKSSAWAKLLDRCGTEAGVKIKRTAFDTSDLDYLADGYWRGPIWAPATVLIEDGLRRSGHVRLADEISARFRALCETHGFAENFDALTGKGLRDRAYTWTAGSYLLFAEAHAGRSLDRRS